MRAIRLTWCVIGLLVAGACGGRAAREGRSERVVLITLDGARWQDVFTGLDENILQASSGANADIKRLDAYKKFSGATAEERRAKLMPFLWRTLVVNHGFIAGDRPAGSTVSVTNRHWFSYPGYSEIITGQAHDAEIKSNDPIRNPFPSVLQFIKTRQHLTAADVATFASWNVFSAIVESEAGATTTNTGIQDYPASAPWIAMANALQTQALTPWAGVRHDALTFRLAMDYLQTHRPHAIYIAFDETDDWAHDGKYERVLDMLHETDGFLRELWSVLQGDPDYAGKTTLIVTTDHGRGRTTADWRRHGHDVPGADEIWIGIFSPDTGQRGVRPGQWFQNQLAATMAAVLGFDYAEQNPQAGKPIDLR